MTGTHKESPARPAGRRGFHLNLGWMNSWSINLEHHMRLPRTRSFFLGMVLFPFVCYCTTTPLDSESSRSATATGSSLIMIPTPRKVERTTGQFALSADVTIHIADGKEVENQFSASQLAEGIEVELGFRPKLTAHVKGRCIVIGRIGTDGFVRKSLRAIGAFPLDSLGNEGYVVHVSPERVLVAAKSGAGVFYGVQTLKQLIRSNRSGTAIPCVTIVDWPALRYRGWMHDISRGPIPTMAFLKQIIVKMAEYKQNFFTLYTEHVFRLNSHPEIAPQDGISAEEIAELSSCAEKYHVELVGNAQSFGHMENILASPFYRRLRENSWVVSPAREETYTFLKEMYAEIIPAYRSNLFHINCDEVTGLGSGPGKRMVDSMGAAGVYAYHISRINDIIRPYGKRILMWGDIAAGNPQIIERLPKDLVIISWGYHAAESFDDAILPFRKTGFDFMVAPGVSCWGQVWPDMSTAVVNIANYVRDGAKLGAMGVMNTVWVDDGENLFNHNWHGLAWGAECSWNPPRPLTGDDARKERETRAGSFNRAFDALFFGVPDVMGTLFLFDSLRTISVRGLVTNPGVWSSMFELYPENVNEEARKNNERVMREAATLMGDVQALRARVQRNREMLDAALFAARRVLFTGKKNLTRIALVRAMESGSHEEVDRAKVLLDDLLHDLHQLKAEYVGLWERENRPWWLSRVLEKYDRLGNQLLDLDKVVFIEPANALANGKRQVRLRTAFADQTMYYTTGGAEPTLRSIPYDGPMAIDRSTLIRARVFVDKQGYGMAEKYLLVHKAIGKLHTLNAHYSLYNPAYAAGGEMALLDGIRGSEVFSDGAWQGFQGQDLDVVIDLEKPTEINKICIGFLQQSDSWILMPERVQLWASEDGATYALVKELVNTVDPKQEGTVVRDVVAEFDDFKTRFVKVIAKTPGKLPAWHHAAGNDAFIFTDEIVVE